MSPRSKAEDQRSGRRQVRAAFRPFGTAAVALAFFSGLVNILALTGSMYMLQIYDRVLGSRNVSTLIALSVLVVGLYLVQGGLEVIRSQILVRIGSRVDRRLAGLAQEARMRLSLRGSSLVSSTQPLRDVDAIRGFLSSQGPIAILDMPWMPVYIAFAFLLHPMLGAITLGGSVFLFMLTLLTEALMRKPTHRVAESAKDRTAIAELAERNTEVLSAMGFSGRIIARFCDANIRHLKAHEKASDLATCLSTISKVFRVTLQSALLGVGAYLTLRNELTPGAIIAVSIAASRALAPIEVAIANWRGLISARASAKRLGEVLSSLPSAEKPLALPPPVAKLRLEAVSVNAPGTQRCVLNGVSFDLPAGQIMAVVGPSAAGKSSLARALTGLWPPVRGSVRLDGAELHRWSDNDLGQHIGYLPQDIQLFDGTITENISRFESEPDSRKVIAAARAADVHELILRLPDGYETRIGAQGGVLSAGQRQRVALARALYGDPFLVVLDEPNSNLDAEGENALAVALHGIKMRNGIAVVISHRPSVLSAVDLIATVSDGQMTAIGPRDEILRKAMRPIAGTTTVPSMPAA